MKPSADKSRPSASPAKKVIKTPTELRKSRVEPTTRVDRGTKPAPRPAPAQEPQPEPPSEPKEVDSQQIDIPILPSEPSKPTYVLPEDPGVAQRSAVHFSAAAGSYVSVAAPLACPEDTPSSSTSETRVSGRNRTAEESAATEREQSLPGGRKLRNKLSFTDRAAQTQHWPSKDRETSPQQSQVEDATGSCSAWEIRDAYVTAATGPGSGTAATPASTALSTRTEERRQHSAQRAHYVTVVAQRMLFQNLNPEIATDFKYWEDPADAARPDEGTLLPLWHFQPSPAAKGRSVTSLSWNPKHKDLFAVGYGSFDPGLPLTGLVACYTLGDATQPECEVPLSSTVLTLAFHPSRPSMLAAGCLDGSVHVIDLADMSNPGVRASSPVALRHGEGVWQVSWAPAPSSLPLRFQAVSSDGALVTWELAPGKDLKKLDAITLPKAPPAPGSNVTAAVGCMHAHPAQPSQVLVGTQEGDVLRYSLDLGTDTMDPYPGHSAPVYTVQWNPLHPTAFLTASADWTVRVWDASNPGQAMMVFDAGAPVGDAAWSPQTSTVFAAATESGRVMVYDLAHNMDWPLCKQKVTQKIKLTKLAFSPVYPVLLVGTIKGAVTCYKLSPNLRKPPQPPAKSAATKERGAQRRGPRGAGGEGVQDQAVEEKPAEKAHRAVALQRDHLGRVLAVAAACRTAEADWVFTPRPSGFNT